ncbi:DUF3800 domain-containing protein [Flavobacterium sp.]|uniref:DUF3800 domain-containing protein n=1 Tax=Flavobacterium sp. TaxID=239 RepID=UPI0026094A52|nr:DUF3800 domain-containing protein [Flavobacterium sp.]
MLPIGGLYVFCVITKGKYMRYKLLLDESGDHGLNKIDPGFPVFVLCGVLISNREYRKLKVKLMSLKLKYWNSDTVILHSRDIRKCYNEFALLFDLGVKERFYSDLNTIMTELDYTVIASAIKKEKFIQCHGKLKDDVYEVALSFVMERALFCLEGKKEDKVALEIGIEKRGQKEDRKLATHIAAIRNNGTYYVRGNRFRNIGAEPHFFSKKENISGLQIADLLAYPIARKIISPESKNPAFELIKPKIYQKDGKLHGLKIFP